MKKEHAKTQYKIVLFSFNVTDIRLCFDFQAFQKKNGEPSNWCLFLEIKGI